MTEVIRLRSIDPQAAMDTIRPLVSKDGTVSANRPGRSLVIADYADNISRIRQILARIDTDANTTTVVALTNAGAREIAASLQALLTGGGAEGAQPNATVVAVDSSNSIAIRGDSNTVAKLVSMAQELDKRAAAGTEVRVYWLDHADARQARPRAPAAAGAGRDREQQQQQFHDARCGGWRPRTARASADAGRRRWGGDRRRHRDARPGRCDAL